ncbi:hypothetical protein C8Q80DRAFT_1266613 [Daedaleopsis nitida]|nr:hypothetical protein C8Q80DRAFT_1266613 [Daedaleopsis nitida]
MDSAAQDPSASQGLPSLPVVPALDDTFGVLLISAFVSLTLYGITLHQAYRYFRTYHKDPAVLRYLVVVVLLGETFHSVILAHTCYFYLVSNYFNPLQLQHGVWSLNLIPGVSGVVIISSQIFFVRRVFLVGPQYRAIAIIAFVLFLVELGFNIAGSVRVFQFRDNVLANLHNLAWVESAGTGALGVADTMLTVVLVIALQRSRTGWKKTDSTIDLLVLYAITTGLLTGIMNAFSFILSLALPSKLYWAGFGIAATRLYANTLLAALNSRESLVKRGMLTFGTTDFNTAENTSLQKIPGQRPSAGVVGAERWNSTRVTHETIEMKGVSEVKGDAASDYSDGREWARRDAAYAV